MPAAAPLHKIRSLHGFWRDLVPIYSVAGVAWTAGGALVMMVLGTLLGVEHVWTLVFTILFLGNFIQRPMCMSVSEADTVERLLIAAGYFRSIEDGRWRPINRRWWWRLFDSPVEISRKSASVDLIGHSSMLRSIKAFLARRAQAMAVSV